MKGVCSEVKIGIAFPIAGLGAAARGITAADGTVIDGFTEHGINRAIGEGSKGMSGIRAGTKPDAILDALKNPRNVTTVLTPRVALSRSILVRMRVVVNPQSGKIVSVNPTTAAGAH
jgi:hypothetical protein